MNNKVIYIGILCIVGLLLVGMKEEFLWVNPLTTTRKYDKHCVVGRLPNCQAINQYNPAYCDVCIFDDGTGEQYQPFIPKNYNDPANRGLGGCELNTYIVPNVRGNKQALLPYYDGLVDEKTSTDLEGGAIGPDGAIKYSDAYIPADGANIGTSRFTTKKDGSGCLPGAFETTSDPYAYGKDEGGFYCHRVNYLKARCVMPVSVIKQWAEQKSNIGGLDMSEIDELPDTGNVHGYYYRSYKTPEHNC